MAADAGVSGGASAEGAGVPKGLAGVRVVDAATLFAGPLMATAEPLAQYTTTPPAMPVMRPAMSGAPDAKAMPRQSGNATKNTTTAEGPSCWS